MLRLLWSHPLVNFEGKWHKILDAGLNPMPFKRLIPIWFGGNADQALERAARLGDGWMPNYRTPVAASSALDKLDRYLEKAGRIRTKPWGTTNGGFGVEASISYGEGVPDIWWTLIDGWQKVGATHISFDTLDAGFSSANEHINAIHKIARVVGLG